ncbi:hypothetical protein BX265_3865 [Streptomyces sp. TLI_235]|nr:hypothetical protein [Streptomyces sp. TLI_235]PBC79070.1 hypothetical protein BX265_3865 [Streptomyces sp. TLI_235]
MTHAPQQSRIEQPSPAPAQRTRHRGGRSRLLCAALVTAAVAIGGTACSGSGEGAGKGSASAQAEVFGPKGYRGLGPGTAKDAALGGGALQGEPMSALAGCALFAYKDGPAPDPAVLAAEKAATTKSKETADKADKAKAEADAQRPGAGASAREYAEDATRSAEVAKLLAESTTAIADETKLIAAREKTFEASGGAKFGTTGQLKQLVAPPKARTAEGLGTGSTEGDLKKAHPAVKAIEGGYTLPVDGAQDWELVFAVDGGKVTAMSLFNTAVKCT